MSNSLFLVCHATLQAVHVAETSGGSWFRGPDNDAVVGAFCSAHYGKDLVPMGEQGLDDAGDKTEGLTPYDVWTPNNFDRLMRHVLGSNADTEQKILQIGEYLAA